MSPSTPLHAPLHIRGPALVIAALALLIPLLVAAPAAAVEDVQPARVAGETRVETAAETALLTYPDGVSTAVLATSVHFQDALAGAALAGAEVAAQLLVQPDDVPDATAEALDALGVEEVLLLGDEARVSAAVEAELAVERPVTRIAAGTPPELAEAIANEVVARTGLPLVDGLPTVLIANGERFPDAIAGSAPAYRAAMPVLYTTQDALYPPTQDVLVGQGVEQAILLGGTDAVGAAVEDQIRDLGIQTQRLAGPTRVETSLAIADFTERELGFDFSALLIARGDDFPDSLTAAQYGGTAGDPILLTASPSVMPESALNWIRTRCPVIEVVRAVGGTAAVTVPLLNDVEEAAESCGDGVPAPPPPSEGTRQTFIVSPQQAQTAEAPAAFELSVGARYDDEQFTGPVDIVLFPCEGAEVLGAGDDTFADVDDDGFADGFGTTDTGVAAITSLNAEPIEPTTVVVAAQPELEGVLAFEVSADAADCAVVVVVDGDGDGELDLDVQDRPVEPYGVGLVRWT